MYTLKNERSVVEVETGRDPKHLQEFANNRKQLFIAFLKYKIIYNYYLLY